MTPRSARRLEAVVEREDVIHVDRPALTPVELPAPSIPATLALTLEL